jgi:hypothetical protein
LRRRRGAAHDRTVDGVGDAVICHGMYNPEFIGLYPGRSQVKVGACTTPVTSRSAEPSYTQSGNLC